MIKLPEAFVEKERPKDVLLSRNRLIMWIADLQMSTDPHSEKGQIEWDILEMVYEYVKEMEGVE